MNQEDLIKLLTESINEHGLMDVYCVCDHGQDPEQVFQAGVSRIQNQDGEIVIIDQEDYDQYPEDYEDSELAFIIN